MEDASANETRVNLHGASGRVNPPGGWSLGSSEAGDVVTIVGPERDLRVAFAIVPLDGTPEEMAAAAWRASKRGSNWLRFI
jgi:hypothetical protein